jgi:hypothetical protein
LKNIYEKEKEAYTARSKFQELIVWRKKLNVPGIAHFSQFEQIKGEMTLKLWETNLEESKRLTIEEKESCINSPSAVDLEMTEIDVNGIHDTLVQIEIRKRKENIKKSRENVKNDIQQVNLVDL